MINATGRLSRKFPEICAKVSKDIPKEKDFHDAVAEVLATQDKEHVEGLKPKRRVKFATKDAIENNNRGMEDDREETNLKAKKEKQKNLPICQNSWEGS